MNGALAAMRPTESIAKLVLEAILPDATLEYRLVQSHGEYDFDLLYADGTVAALEVTGAVDQTLMKTVGAIRGKRAGGPVIKPSLCKKSWVIFPSNGASIPKIRADADRCLARLEKEGVGNFSCVSSSATVQEICCQLQITGGGCFSAGCSPKIRIEFPIGGGAVGASLAIEAGEKEASKQDNRKKLGDAKSAMRHLVVYIDASNGLPWSALTNFAPPPVLPVIPDEITNLWLIGPTEEEHQFVGWYASTHEIWRSIRVVLPSA